MLGKLFGLFTGGSTTVYIGLAVMLLVAALSGGTYYYHKQYLGQVTTNAVLQADNNNLIEKIKQDSDAITKLSIDSAARQKASDLALQAAQQQAQYYNKKAQSILLAQAQAPTNLCTSADLLFNDYIEGVK